MVVWKGGGILVAFVIAAFGLLVGFGSGYLADATGNDFFQTNNWIVGVTLILSGICCFFLGKLINTRKHVDEETGETIITKYDNSFLFIKIEYWGFILPVLGIIAFFVNMNWI
ncbi:MAG: hypothetical protein FWG40_12100 [Peptococcaceae bacterium]|nr:hypothetical protein [Peptococcaceae bacterium]